MNMLPNYYTKNGWSGIYGSDLPTGWGSPWNYTGIEDEQQNEIYNIVKEKELYVRWVGEEFKMNYVYYDSNTDPYADGRVISSGSTMVVNYIGGDKNAEVSQYYGSPMMEDTMTAPVRHGYKFINWHSTSSEFFSEDNIATPGTVYLYGRDMTMYAEWEPIDYKIRYQGDGNVDDGEGHKAKDDPTIATYYVATLSFDQGIRNPNFKMNDNRFERDGYTWQH